MKTVPRLSLFKVAVQKIIDDKVENPNSESEALTFSSPDSRPKKILKPGLNSLSTQNSIKTPAIQRSPTLGQFFSNLMSHKESIEPDGSPTVPKVNKFKSLVSTFLKVKKIAPTREPLTPEQIRHKFQRAFQIIRVMSRLYRISEDIQLYGTSSNLYDLTTRDRTRVQKILYTSVIDENEMRNNEERDMKWFILHPKGRFRPIWSVVVIITLLYTAIITPYRLTFDVSSSTAWSVVDYIVDGVFGVDIIMNFVSSYYDDEGKLVKDVLVLTKNYLKSWFIIDLIAVFPFDLIQTWFVDDGIVSPNQANFNTIIRLLRLPRLYRLARLIRLNHIFKFAKGTKIIELIELNSLLVKLVSFFLTVVTAMHIMACLWYFIAKVTPDSTPTWISNTGLENSDNATIYVASLYYIFVILATVGYGDISANNIQERLFSICLMVLGVAFYSFTIAFIASTLSARENRESALKRKISIANEFADEIRAPRSLKARIAQILEYNSFRNCFSWAGKRELFSEIPITLRYEIVMSMHNSILNSIPFFREHTDKYFVVSIAEMLKPLQLKARDFLWKAGDSAESMYFLIGGKVHLISMEYLSSDDRINNVKSSIIFKRFMAGSYFGEIEIINKSKRVYSLQASTEAELFYLTKHDYYNLIVAEFPHIHKEFREIGTERDKRNAESLIEIRNYLQAHIPEEKRESRLVTSRSNSRIHHSKESVNNLQNQSNKKSVKSIDQTPNSQNSQSRGRDLKKKFSFTDHVNQTHNSVISNNLRRVSSSSKSPKPNNSRLSNISYISMENLPPKLRKPSFESHSDSSSSLFTNSGSISSIMPESSSDESSSKEDEPSLTRDIILPKTSKSAAQPKPQTLHAIITAQQKKEEPIPQGRMRSKSSFFSPIVFEDFKRRKSVGMALLMKTGAIISSEESLSRRKKGRNRENSLLKLAIGIEEVSSPADSKKTASPAGPKKGKTKLKPKKKLIRDKDHDKMMRVLKKADKGKIQQQEKAGNLKKDIASNDVRMKALEDKLQGMIQNIQNLIE